MCEEDPLQILSPALISKSLNGNPKGRPRKLQSIAFGAPPRSIVSRLIQKMLSENNVALPLKLNAEERVLEDQNASSDHDQNSIDEPIKKRKPDQYSCDFIDCSYSTKLSSNLLKHKRKHTEEKPYLCDRCSFRTNFSNSLKVHKRLHTTERPYKCKHCDYKCNSISNLKKHSFSRHKNKDCEVWLEVNIGTQEDKIKSL